MWLSLFLLVVGSVLGSPTGALLAICLAALCALAPVLVGPKGQRLAGIIVAAVSIGLIIAYLPKAKNQMDAYQKRAGKKTTSETPALPPMQNK